MSSGSITISYTTLAEIAVAAAVIGGVAFIGSKQISTPISADSPSTASAPASASKAAKNKKKRATGTAGGAGEPIQRQVEHVVDQLGASVQQVGTSVQKGVQAIKENESVKEAVAQVQQTKAQVEDKVGQVASQIASQTPAVPGTTTTNGAKKKNKNKNKSGNKTPPVAAEEKKKEDMRDYELEPENPPARVMKIVGGEIGAPKSNGESNGWENPDSFGGDDEGEWESVVSKKPSRPSTPSLSTLSSTQQPSRQIPGLAHPAAQTKKQRENALKKAKEDALKREKEEEQERRLKAHRETLQRARAQEAALARRPKPSSQNYFGSEPTAAPKAVNGNLHAGLDPTSDGSLVWD